MACGVLMDFIGMTNCLHMYPLLGASTCGFNKAEMEATVYGMALV